MREQAGAEAGGGVALPWASPLCWGERREYFQARGDRSIRSARQCRCGKPNPGLDSLEPPVSLPVIACLHNLEDAFTGHAGEAIREAGVELDERRLRDGEPLPALDEVDGLLSLGGEQSVLDIDSDPVLAAEAALLAEAVSRGIPVLGVCLGAQLLAHALGGRV